MNSHHRKAYSAKENYHQRCHQMGYLACHFASALFVQMQIVDLQGARLLPESSGGWRALHGVLIGAG